MEERIKKLRKILGLSQAQFAVRIGKTPGFISLVETGRSSMSEDTIQTVSEVMGVSEAWLREGKGEMFTEGESSAAFDREGTGQRIRMLRNKLGLTSEQFALEVPCSRKQLYNVENGKTIPSEQFLKRVAEAFSISYQWLFNGIGTIDEDGGTPEMDADRIRNYMLKDSVARDVVLEIMKKDRSIWLKIDRMLRDGI